jgi:hypothetical protein
MANSNGFEALSVGLFVEVLSCLPRIQDRLVLSLVSKSLYTKVIPHVYDHWEFHGYDHSFRSLFYFLRTIVLNPDVASRVQKLDIRDWDKKRSDRAEYEEESDDGDETDEEEEDDDERDEEAEHEKAARAEKKAKRSLVREEIVLQEVSEEERYDQYIPLFSEAVSELEIEQTSKDWFYEWINNRDPDILLALLITRLPSLKTLYMTIPEEQAGVLNTVADLGNGSIPGVLENVKTVYVCSALHIGVSDRVSPQTELLIYSSTGLIPSRLKDIVNTISTWIKPSAFSKSRASALSAS